MAYDATTTIIFDIPPYGFYVMIGVVFTSTLFMLLLLKYGYSVSKYTKVFFLSGVGLLIGAKIFGCLTGLYGALASNETVTLETFLHTGIVFYGGLIGFFLSFVFICKKWDKKIDYGLVDLAVVCAPLFHFFGRLGCFFGGCCFGIKTASRFSVMYTTHIKEQVDTALRIPIPLVEATLNILIFFILFMLLIKEKFRGHLLKIYLLTYAIMRIVLEFFRGDLARGVWNGVSFSQVISIIIIISCIAVTGTRKIKGEQI